MQVIKFLGINSPLYPQPDGKDKRYAQITFKDNSITDPFELCAALKEQVLPKLQQYLSNRNNYKITDVTIEDQGAGPSFEIISNKYSDSFTALKGEIRKAIDEYNKEVQAYLSKQLKESKYNPKFLTPPSVDLNEDAALDSSIEAQAGTPRPGTP